MHSIRGLEEGAVGLRAKARPQEEATKVKSSMARYPEASMEGRRKTRLSMAKGEIINSASELTKPSLMLNPLTSLNYFSFSVDMKPLNLYKVQDWVDQGRLDPSKPITIKELQRSRCVTNVKDGVKLLAKGSEELKAPLHVVISRASAKAIATIEAAGGSVTTRYYTPFAMRRIMQGKMDPINSLQSQIKIGEEMQQKSFYNRLPDPTSRKDIEYYRDPAHRGYLSHLVPEGHGPSLFFKTPGTGKMAVRKTSKSRAVAGDNRIW